MSNLIKQIFIEHGITHVTTDSRQVIPGGAFIAIQGYNVDGNRYIDSALKNGAKVIISDKPELQDKNNIYIVKDSSVALAEAAQYLHPLKVTNIVAVTGTNGKTSTTHFYMQILKQINIRAAAIGTTGIYYFDGTKIVHTPLPVGLTTPDILTFHQVAEQLANQGVTHIAIEASSHGLAQKRLWGAPIKAAAFTSFSHDHLDYHKTMDEYLSAKMQLFSHYMINQAPCYISSTLPNYKIIQQQIISYGNSCSVIGHTQDCDVIIQEYLETIEGSTALIIHHGQKAKINTHLIGDFQISNTLLAWMLACATTDIALPLTVLNNLTSIPGRMERISPPDSNKHIFVDFAHTPDSLERSLQTLKPLCKGRLITVFGCGGDRDHTKRPLMGKVASKLADIVIITDDNPRTENPESIRLDILAQAPEAMEIGDRKLAIIKAIELMHNNDILLIAGKGHENYQIIGTTKFILDDREIVRDKINEL